MLQKYFCRQGFLLLCGIVLFGLVSCISNDNKPRATLLIEEHVENPNPLIRIYEADPKGTDLQLLYEFDAQNEYWLSPNGQYLALFSMSSDRDWFDRDITIIELASGETVSLISEVGYFYPNGSQLRLSSTSVLWSPFSDKILFKRNALEGAGKVIWVYDLETNAETPLTSGERLRTILRGLTTGSM